MNPIKRVGGQALFHGILMRCGNRVSTAIREKDGSLTVTVRTMKPSKKNKLNKLPIIRGLSALIGSVSASIKTTDRSPKKILRMVLILIVYLCAALGMGFLLDRVLENAEFSSYLTENLSWCGLFFAELVLMAVFLRRIPAMRRLFQYHAAEHMTINCYEQGKELTAENVRQCPRTHQRCGTNLAVNCFVLVLIFEVFLPPIPCDLLYYAIDVLGTLILFGIAYEAMRYTEKHNNRLTRILSLPGSFVQRFVTTLPPAEDMIECGIAALQEGLREP